MPMKTFLVEATFFLDNKIERHYFSQSHFDKFIDILADLVQEILSRVLLLIHLNFGSSTIAANTSQATPTT